MNKQELLKKIDWHLEETESERSAGTFDEGYQQGCEYCIALIEQLDEPEKVKVPAYVAEFVNYINSEKIPPCDIVADMLNALVPEDILLPDHLQKDKLFDYFDLACNRHDFEKACILGYEVEKQQKWVVLVDGLYAARFTISSSKEKAEIDRSEYLECAIHFKNEDKASVFAELVGGKVAPVEGE